MYVIEPILAVLPEPCLSLASFHFSQAKSLKSFTTEAMERRLSTAVTLYFAPVLFSSSANSLTRMISVSSISFASARV